MSTLGGTKQRRLLFVVESGTDVRLVEGLGERFELSVLARRIDGGVEVSQTPTAGVRLTVGPASRAGFARMAFDEVRRGRYDFVIVQGYAAAALAANVAGRAVGTPVMMLACSPVERYYECRREHAEEGKPFRRAELAALGALARVNARVGQQYLVLSEHLAGVVRAHGTRRPVEVVPVYGVDTQIFSPASGSKGALRERLGLPRTGQLVFFSSRIAPEKDAETLLAAVRLLRDRGRDVRVLHRSGGHRAFLAAARAFGVEGRVIATDAVHPHGQLADDYRASDLCVQASREEGLGFSPLEALACGVPVVAASVGGLRETIVDGRTGWSYPAGDAAALARAMDEALGDPAEAKRRARAGREMVVARYDRRVVFGRLEEVVRARLRAGSEGVANANGRLADGDSRGPLREEADPL
jgi:glycosyltransferase involved in cell wall biosynthesis